MPMVELRPPFSTWLVTLDRSKSGVEFTQVIYFVFSSWRNVSNENIRLSFHFCNLMTHFKVLHSLMCNAWALFSAPVSGILRFGTQTGDDVSESGQGTMGMTSHRCGFLCEGCNARPALHHG